jgi:SAM-dependent methyltransferase
MIGHYTTGAGRASKCCAVHTKVFNTKMIGTFNIQIPKFILFNHAPTIFFPEHDNWKKRYWFVKMSHKNAGEHFGWAVRDKNSKQRANTLEVLTKTPLPDNMKEGNIEVELPKKWSHFDVQSWARDKYWFQGFDFAPVQRADSKSLWLTIDTINWSGLSVLDYGCHYGYMSFEASRKGAIVWGIDNNSKSLNMARTIRDHVIQQDVKFSKQNSFVHKSFDVVIYLSVHHQVDKNYIRLEQAIGTLKNTARKFVFLELILPPMFPKDRSMSEQDIDNLVASQGGFPLRRYKHNVRGERKVYMIEV